MVASKLSISRGEQRPGPRGNTRLLSLVMRVARVALGGNLVPTAHFQSPGKATWGLG